MSIDDGVIVADRSVPDSWSKVLALRLAAARVFSIYWGHDQINGRQEGLYSSTMGRLNMSQEMALMVFFRKFNR